MSVTLRFVSVVASISFAASATTVSAQEHPPSIVSAYSSARQVPESALLHSKRARSAEVDLSALKLSSKLGKKDQQEAYLAPALHFELFPDVAFDAKGVRIKQDQFGTTSWVGRIAGRKNSQVIITSDGDVVFGRVDIGLSQYTLRGNA